MRSETTSPKKIIKVNITEIKQAGVLIEETI